jgi:hypothetical protein
VLPNPNEQGRVLARGVSWRLDDRLAVGGMEAAATTRSGARKRSLKRSNTSLPNTSQPKLSTATQDRRHSYHAATQGRCHSQLPATQGRCHSQLPATQGRRHSHHLPCTDAAANAERTICAPCGQSTAPRGSQRRGSIVINV